MPSVTGVAELQKLLASFALFAVIDGPEWGEFECGQILGARSLPRGSVERYLPYLVPKNDVTIVFVCNDGRRSTRAAVTAEAMGLHACVRARQGLGAWKKPTRQIRGRKITGSMDFGFEHRQPDRENSGPALRSIAYVRLFDSRAARHHSQSLEPRRIARVATIRDGPGGGEPSLRSRVLPLAALPKAAQRKNFGRILSHLNGQSDGEPWGVLIT